MLAAGVDLTQTFLRQEFQSKSPINNSNKIVVLYQTQINSSKALCERVIWVSSATLHIFAFKQ